MIKNFLDRKIIDIEHSPSIIHAKLELGTYLLTCMEIQKSANIVLVGT